jgi:hypothetical protein
VTLSGSYGAGGASGRAVTAYVIVVVAALLAPVAILGTWAQRHVVSTQGYVNSVGPLSDDPGVQSSVTDVVTKAVVASLPSLPKGVTKSAEQALVGAAVTEIVQGPTFHALWVTANGQAHRQVLAQLSEPEAAQVAINLGPIAEAVRLQLVANGLAALKNVSFASGDESVVLVPAGSLSHTRRLWSAFESSTHWLAPLLLALAVLAIVVAPRRRRVLLAEAVGLLAAIGVSALVTSHGHTAYVDRLQGLSAADAARAIGDVLVTSLEHWLRDLTVVAGLVALVALASLVLPSPVRSE